MKVDLNNSKCFYVVGNEYDYNNLYLFTEKPEKDIDESGSCYYSIKERDKDNKIISEYFGIKLPKTIGIPIGFPDFDGYLGLSVYHENINDFLIKKKLRVNENNRIEIL